MTPEDVETKLENLEERLMGEIRPLKVKLDALAARVESAAQALQDEEDES